MGLLDRLLHQALDTATRWRVALFVAMIALVLAALLWSRPVQCSACIGQFCGFSSQCPTSCFCAIPIGAATGACFGTR